MMMNEGSTRKGYRASMAFLRHMRTDGNDTRTHSFYMFFVSEQRLFRSLYPSRVLFKFKN